MKNKIKKSVTRGIVISKILSIVIILAIIFILAIIN